MLNIGHFNQLNVIEIGAHGVILDGGDSGQLLLSLKQCPAGLASGDKLDVFIFLDAQGEPVPTTDSPAAELNQIAWLEVVETNHLGAFADWGLSKDLFIPFAEQQQTLNKGRHALVRIYMDNQGRLAGSTRIDHWVKDEPQGLQPRDKVKLMIAEKTELGYKAIINHEYWGLLYSNELYQRMRKGQVMDGFIKRIRKDGKVDLTLNQPGYSRNKMEGITEKILSALEENGGFLAFTDKSPPEQIYARFKVSKRVFKQALGTLYKNRQITLESTGIRCVEGTGNGN